MPFLRLRALGLPFIAGVGLASCGGDNVTLPSDALPATIDAMAGDAQSGVVGRALGDSLVVRLTDSRDRPVLGQPVEFRALAGSDSSLLQPDTAISDADGLARSRWILGQTAGIQTVRARVLSPSTRSSLAVTFTATAAPEAADTILAVRGQDQVARGGGTLPESLVVAVTDRFGNPLEGVTVTWSVPAGQGSVSASSGVTGADGRTAVSRTLGFISGPQSATARVTSAANVELVFRHTALAGGAVRLVRISADHQVAPVGSRLADSMVVMAQDIAGNGVPGETITWVAEGDGSAAPTSSVTNFEGKAWTFWTLPDTAGSTTLTAAGFGDAIRFTATATAASADTLLALSPTSFDATAGQDVASGQRPSVRVADSIGNPVQGVPVTFDVTQGGGTIADGNGSGTTVTLATNGSGTATLSSWTLGSAAGSNVVRASASRPAGGALHGSPVTFTATGQVGSATTLVFGVEPASTKAGDPIAPAVTVLVQDHNGNTVTGSSQQVTIALGANPGAGALSGTLTVDASSGVASFGNLSVNRTGAGYTLVATASGLTSATSNDFNINPGTATRLGFLAQPSNAGAGAMIAPPVMVAVQDQFGNTVTTSAAGVNLTLGANPGGGTLSGGGSVNAVNGVATFDQLSIDAAAAGYTLVARSGSLSSATSAAFTIGSGGAAKLAFVVQPATVAAGAAITPVVQVAIQDANGNTASSSDSVMLTLGNNPGSATLTGGRARAVNGIASFPGLTLDKTGSGYTLVADDGAGGLAAVTSGAFDVQAGTGNRLVFLTPPGTTAAGVAITPAIRVAVQDASGNTLTSATDSIRLSLNPGGGNLGGTVGKRAVNGVATFSDITVGTAAANYTITAFAPLSPLISATSPSFDVTRQSTTTTITSDTPDPSAVGEPYTVAFQVSGPGGSPSGTVTVTAGSDSCQGTLTAGSGSCQLTGTAAGAVNLTAGYSGDVAFDTSSTATPTAHTVNPAIPTAIHLVFTQDPTDVKAGDKIRPPVKVEIRDQDDSLVASDTNQVTVALGNNFLGLASLAGTTTRTTRNGVATFDDLVVNGITLVSSFTLVATTPGATDSATSAIFRVSP